MEFSLSQKGNTVLFYQGFEYLNFYKTTANVITWRCRKSRSLKCHAFLKTKDDKLVVNPNEHCHDSYPQKAKANKAISEMKENMKTVGATTRNVLGTVCGTLNDDILEHFPKKSSIERTLRRAKENQHLENPTTPYFAIPEKYADLILYDSGDEDPDRLLAIGDKDILQQLNTDTIFGDGTFDKVPHVFYQLYTWHAQVGNSYPPCIYFLLQRKNQETYNKMFDALLQLLPSMSPTKILVDFEKACISAAHTAFPNAEVKGCYFHLCQSLIRKVNSVGLKARFENDIDIKLQLKSLVALTFVPINDVRNVFQQLAATFPDEDSFNEILTYFFSTYIEGAAGRDPKFPILLWNHMNAAAEGGPKTTNCCEGFHNTLNSVFHYSHPSVWLFLDGLKKDIACHKLTLANVRAGRPEKRRRKYEDLLQRVANVVQQYDTNPDKLKYLRTLANLQ